MAFVRAILPSMGIMIFGGAVGYYLDVSHILNIPAIFWGIGSLTTGIAMGVGVIRISR